ncbi:unnamed protein product [Dibothriocephalus latus]|uniref:Uncharacterized protein n=1 Tax=Dibothriocephalus latus TaxID=60516 RepID=A0A3P7RJT1_DIBLA|nr:unnamed protein product [Dibothriocephalus latus]
MDVQETAAGSPTASGEPLLPPLPPKVEETDLTSSSAMQAVGEVKAENKMEVDSQPVDERKPKVEKEMKRPGDDDEPLVLDVSQVLTPFNLFLPTSQVTRTLPSPYHPFSRCPLALIQSFIDNDSLTM